MSTSNSTNQVPLEIPDTARTLALVMEDKPSTQQNPEQPRTPHMRKIHRRTPLSRRLASQVQAANRRPLSSRERKMREEHSIRQRTKPIMEQSSVSTTIRTRILGTTRMFRTLAQHSTSVCIPTWSFPPMLLPPLNTRNGRSLSTTRK